MPYLSNGKEGSYYCKHKNGYLVESVDAWTSFDVTDGIVDEIGSNELGNISGYLYHCNDCGREWKWKARPHLKWLQRIYEQLHCKQH